MHIPGHGFLSFGASVATSIATVGGVGFALHWLRRNVTGKIVARMAALAALIFAGQMLNYPVSGGTSGHLIGAMLAAVIVGPYAATVVMASVLLVQCALFGDGGYFSLGANVLNMSVIAVWVGWAFYRVLKDSVGLPGCLALFVGSWASVMAAAAACSLQIAYSGTAPLAKVLPAMLNVHSTIGIGEGIITVATYAAVVRVVPVLVAAMAPEGEA